MHVFPSDIAKRLPARNQAKEFHVQGVVESFSGTTAYIAVNDSGSLIEVSNVENVTIGEHVMLLISSNGLPSIMSRSLGV